MPGKPRHFRLLFGYIYLISAPPKTHSTFTINLERESAVSAYGLLSLNPPNTQSLCISMFQWGGTSKVAPPNTVERFNTETPSCNSALLRSSVRPPKTVSILPPRKIGSRNTLSAPEYQRIINTAVVTPAGEF